MNKIINGFFRITSSNKYIPEVDGIRFIAIISVLILHASQFYLSKQVHQERTDILNHYFYNGFTGVILFFVLSGHILSLPFAKQFSVEKPDKKLKLKAYFLRRLTRLEPPYIIALILFFIMFVVLTHKYTFQFMFPHFLASLFYSSGFIYGGRPLINGVLWTLEIEVQFYIIAPFLCYFIFHNKLSSALRIALLSAAIILFTVLKWYIAPPFECLWQYLSFFLTGILLTEVLKSKKIIPAINKIKNVATLVLLLVIFYFDYRHSVLLFHVALNFLILFTYVLILQYKSFNSFFSNRFICIIGGACYSIYLFHFPIISSFVHLLANRHFIPIELLNQCVQIVIYILVTLPVCLIFYKFCERPFMDKTWPEKFKNFVKNLGS